MPPKKKRARSARSCRRPSCRTRPRGPRRRGRSPGAAGAAAAAAEQWRAHPRRDRGIKFLARPRHRRDGVSVAASARRGFRHTGPDGRLRCNALKTPRSSRRSSAAGSSATSTATRTRRARRRRKTLLRSVAEGDGMNLNLTRSGGDATPRLDAVDGQDHLVPSARRCAGRGFAPRQTRAAGADRAQAQGRGPAEEEAQVAGRARARAAGRRARADGGRPRRDGALPQAARLVRRRARRRRERRAARTSGRRSGGPCSRRARTSC